MNKLKIQIQEYKKSIFLKKIKLEKLLYRVEDKVTSNRIFDFSLLSSLIVGFFISPKKLGHFVLNSLSLKIKEFLSNFSGRPESIEIVEVKPRKKRTQKKTRSTKKSPAHEK